MDWKKEGNVWTIEEKELIGSVFKDGTFSNKKPKFSAKVYNKYTHELLFYSAKHYVTDAKSEVEDAIEFRLNK